MKLKVLYVDHTLMKSGATISLVTLLKSIASRVEPFYLFRLNSESVRLVESAPGVVYDEHWMPQFMTTRYGRPYSLSLILWHLLKFPFAFLHFRSLIRSARIDLVHLNETTLVAYVYFAWWLDLPVVMHARTATIERRFERRLLHLAGLYRRCAIIAIDEENHRSLPESCREKTHIIHNPVELGPLPTKNQIESLRTSWGCLASSVVIGQVASLHRHKGIWEILRLAEIVCPRYSNVHFVYVGDKSGEGGEGPDLEHAIVAKRLQGRIHLAGYHDDLAAVYGALDIVLCLFGRGLGGVGRSAYEAAVAGKPLLATIPDPNRTTTLRHLENSLLYDPENEAGIQEGLFSLIESEDLRVSLGSKAQASIGLRHDPLSIGRRVCALYDNLVAETT